jgi:hypothetical protein
VLESAPRCLRIVTHAVDAVHNLAAVGFDERPIDVVFRDCLRRALPVVRFSVGTNDVVREHYRNDASAIPG